MSFRLHPFVLNQGMWAEACKLTSAEKRYAVQRGVTALWKFDDSFLEKVCGAAENLPLTEDFGSDQELELAAVTGLAIGAADAKELPGTYEDWKAVVVEDFQQWTKGRINSEAQAVLDALCNGRRLNGQPGPGEGEARYTILNPSETSVLRKALDDLVASNAASDVPELAEFLADLREWTSTCAVSGRAFLLACF